MQPPTKKASKRGRTGKAASADKWAAFDALTDEDIARAVAEDPDAAPILGEEFWKNAKLVMPTPKQAISIRLDTDVLDFFKGQGPGYQSRINAVLRSYVDTIMRTRRALIEGEGSGIDDRTPEDISKAVRDARGRA